MSLLYLFDDLFYFHLIFKGHGNVSDNIFSCSSTSDKLKPLLKYQLTLGII